MKRKEERQVEQLLDMQNTEENCEMIWKKDKSNSEKIWPLWKKLKLNS